MPYAVELYFDEASDLRVRDLWRELASIGAASMDASGARPHVSLAVCDAVDVPRAGKWLERFAAATPPFPISLASFGAFPADSPVAFLAPKVTPELLGMQAEFSAQLAMLADGIWGHYSPARWVPHCTLSTGVPCQTMGRVIECCHASGLPIVGTVTEIGLVSFQPIKQRVVAPLGRHATMEERGGRVVREEVRIEPYDPGWVALFERERDHLRACLPVELLGRIEHFGSTSVAGLAAKPIVDMLVEVTDLGAARERIVPLLEDQGYDYFWRPTGGADDGEPWYAWFIKRSSQGERTHHIHMVERNHPQWDQLRFRDILEKYPEVAAAYVRLKTDLAAAYPNDREAYTNGKAEFIADAVRRGRG